MSATTTNATLTAAGKEALKELFAWASANPGKISRRGNSRRTLAYVPRDHAAYDRLAATLKPIQGGHAPAGVIVVEWLTPHQDALSVSGMYLSPSDEMAPVSKILWAAAKDDGSPDIEYIGRDSGGLAKAMKHLW